MSSAPTATTSSRRWVGSFRLAAGVLLLVALTFQTVEKIANDDMVASRYFSYFTIQSTIIGIVVLFVGGVLALVHPVDSPTYTAVRLSVLVYSIVTAGVYNLLLRGIPDEGFVSTAWPGEIMHVWIPLVFLLDWLFSPGRPALRWTALRIVVAYPLVWIAFTLVRGAATGWYPYPFLEPGTGWLSVAAYIVAISALVIGLASLGIAHSRRLQRRYHA
jgi:hypothetical protein